MDLLASPLQDYVEAHTTPESELLARINRETNVHVLMPHMLSGHLQGRFLSMISKMIRPMRILEIGTFTGYSALCLAEGLTAGGKLITIDKNEELEYRVKGYFQSSKFSEQIDYMIGDARQILPFLNEVFDLVFIDADKQNYGLYYDLIIGKVASGGYLLADNVLWSGKVVEDNPDRDTRAIINFNLKIQTDPGIENVLLPIRDGIMVIRKF